MTGIVFPTSIEQLLHAGPGFLTEAFRSTGAISAGNHVKAIAGATEFFGGGMGRKLILTVEYARQEKNEKTELFVKFPRDFGDPLRSVFAPFMNSETRFALLTKAADLPIHVPFCLFADYDPSSETGLLITERVLFGQGNVDPAYEKCMDYKLETPLPYYQALAPSLARLAGYSRSDRFGANLARHFPPNQDTVFAVGRAALVEKLQALTTFAETVPHLFPDGLGDKAFLEEFCTDVLILFENEQKIRGYLESRLDQIALCHINTNVDNAWFIRTSSGILEAGLLDWGGVGQMNLGAAYYGMVCSAERDFLNVHRRDLIELVARLYEEGGGPRVDPDDLALSARLAFAMFGAAYMLDAPKLIADSIPDYRTLTSRFDPRIEANFLARVQLNPLILLLNEWREDDFGQSIRQISGQYKVKK